MRKSAIAPLLATMLVALTSTIAASGVEGAYTCSAATSCLSANQSAAAGSSGAAIKGTATNSYGLRGVSTNDTGTFGQSASGTYLDPGIEGESTATGNGLYDAAGSFGLTALTGGRAPSYGVVSVGSTSGVLGQNIASAPRYTPGVTGSDISGFGYGVLGESFPTSKQQGGIGVFGVLAESSSNSYVGSGVFGQGLGSTTYYGSLTAGIGFAFGGYFASNKGEAGAGIGVEGSEVAGLFYNTTSANFVGIGYSDYPIDAQGTSSNDTFTVDNSGNVAASGTISGKNLQSSGDAQFRQTASNGSTLTAYGMRSAAPELEDIGQGEMVNGRGLVHIDAKLAGVIDHRAAYHVFVTPNADCNGLYVTQKTQTSFVVAELKGGRTTLDFDYRIVAMPLGHTAERLAVAPPIRQAAVPAVLRQADGKAMQSPALAVPLDRALRAAVGPQRYAKLIAAKRKELATR